MTDIPQAAFDKLIDRAQWHLAHGQDADEFGQITDEQKEWKQRGVEILKLLAAYEKRSATESFLDLLFRDYIEDEELMREVLGCYLPEGWLTVQETDFSWSCILSKTHYLELKHSHALVVDWK